MKIIVVNHVLSAYTCAWFTFRWAAANRPFALRLVGTSTTYPRSVSGKWRNRRLPRKWRPRNTSPLLPEKRCPAGGAAAALEKGAGLSRGRKQDSPLPTGAAPRTKAEKGRREGMRENPDHPGRLSRLSQRSVPGSSMTSPWWAKIQSPSPPTGSDARKASRPPMENPRGSTQTTQSPPGAFCSLPR